MSQARDQKRFTISEVAADWRELMIAQRTMQPSIAGVSEQLESRLSELLLHGWRLDNYRTAFRYRMTKIEDQNCTSAVVSVSVSIHQCLSDPRPAGQQETTVNDERYASEGSRLLADRNLLINCCCSTSRR